MCQLRHLWKTPVPATDVCLDNDLPYRTGYVQDRKPAFNEELRQPSNVAPKHGLKDVNVTAKTPVAAYAALTRLLAHAQRCLEAAAATLARVFRECGIEV